MILNYIEPLQINCYTTLISLQIDQIDLRIFSSSNCEINSTDQIISLAIFELKYRISKFEFSNIYVI